MFCIATAIFGIGSPEKKEGRRKWWKDVTPKREKKKTLEESLSEKCHSNMGV